MVANGMILLANSAVGLNGRLHKSRARNARPYQSFGMIGVSRYLPSHQFASSIIVRIRPCIKSNSNFEALCSLGIIGS
jgi:hypothetical protein